MASRIVILRAGRVGLSASFRASRVSPASVIPRSYLIAESRNANPAIFNNQFRYLGTSVSRLSATSQHHQKQTEMTTNESSGNTGNKKPSSRIGKLIQKSKEMVTFYKNGLKQLWSNQKLAKALQVKVQQDGYNLTRSEYQLVHRSKKDMIKLIPFGFIFLILPESIPLFVIFVPGIIPSTCVTESQVIKQREKLDKVRQTMSQNVLLSSQRIPGISVDDFLSPHTFAKVAKTYNADFQLTHIKKDHLSAFCKFLGLQSWGTKSMLENRLQKHMNYLLEDDKLLDKEGVDKLDVKELQQAVEERGMRSLGASKEHLSTALKYWIAMRLGDQPVEDGLLIMSRMFLLNAVYKS
ncbi:hypothetical protein VTP01DRAFT_7316 [Rhizomucor pusillus]|uniref:uncharacterized protein n=1 Tax=Rhizomucor pusillus TaxID=4840 RepID=UPI003743B913